MIEFFKHLFGDRDIPHFILPKELFGLDEVAHNVSNMVVNLRCEIDKGKLIASPFDSFFISTKFCFENDLDNPRDCLVILSDARRVAGGIVGNYAVMVEIDNGVTVLFDVGNEKAFSYRDGKLISGKSIKGEDDASVFLYGFAKKLGLAAFDLLTILLSMETEQRVVKKLLPKRGTSAQRKKAPDRYATEIRIDFTPELKRIISERSETANRGSGGTKSPHMRRGFIKTQRYGPKLSKVKEIFIEAVHVNKDKGPSTPKQTYRFRVTDQNQGLTV